MAPLPSTSVLTTHVGEDPQWNGAGLLFVHLKHHPYTPRKHLLIGDLALFSPKNNI